MAVIRVVVVVSVIGDFNMLIYLYMRVNRLVIHVLACLFMRVMILATTMCLYVYR